MAPHVPAAVPQEYLKNLSCRQRRHHCAVQSSSWHLTALTSSFNWFQLPHISYFYSIMIRRSKTWPGPEISVPIWQTQGREGDWLPQDELSLQILMKHIQKHSSAQPWGPMVVMVPWALNTHTHTHPTPGSQLNANQFLQTSQVTLTVSEKSWSGKPEIHLEGSGKSCSVERYWYLLLSSCHSSIWNKRGWQGLSTTWIHDSCNIQRIY